MGWEYKLCDVSVLSVLKKLMSVNAMVLYISCLYWFPCHGWLKNWRVCVTTGVLHLVCQYLVSITSVWTTNHDMWWGMCQTNGSLIQSGAGQNQVTIPKSWHWKKESRVAVHWAGVYAIILPIQRHGNETQRTIYLVCHVSELWKWHQGNKASGMKNMESPRRFEYLSFSEWSRGSTLYRCIVLYCVVLYECDYSQL